MNTRGYALGKSLLLGLGAALAAAACIVEVPEDDSDKNRNEFIDGAGHQGGAGAGSHSDGSTSTATGQSDPSATTTSGSNPTGTMGGACDCDSDCAPVDAQPGVCVYGVCMVKASATCSAGGSTAECPSGSVCWGIKGHEGSICWPTCDANSCAGTCDSDGICGPSQDTNCSYSCGSYCSCEPGDCAAGETCVGGSCQPDVTLGPGPGKGPGPTCANLPQRDCVGSNCGDLVVFNPRTTPHYDDYPINGETASNQYRSYIRRDLAMLLDYASAKTYCKSQGWPGNGGPLGFGDMSEVNGDIPGTAINQPGHPPNTHTNGHDIDLAYYQQNTVDNKLRPICTHADYHCTAPPHLMDTWRTALFLGYIFESKTTRVIGVDGQAGPMIKSAISQLCQDGWLDSFACSNAARLAYETVNMNYGWYYFHHHHAHISVCNGPCQNAQEYSAMEAIGPGFNYLPVKANPHYIRWSEL
jgi:hypothetical protein